jgi:hypothetical protein
MKFFLFLFLGMSMFVPRTAAGRGLALSALVGVGGLGWTTYRILYFQPVRPPHRFDLI